MPQYRCKYFNIRELVPEELYNRYKDWCWNLFDDRALITIDRLRYAYGSIIINDWLWGGKNHFRGFRPPYCDVGAEYSQHRYGRAFDCIFTKTTAQAVRDDLINNGGHCFEFVTAIEDGVDWFHFDVRNCSRLLRFKPQVRV